MNYKENNNYGKVIIITDIHYCDKDWYNYKNKDKMDVLCEKLNDEYEEEPYDMILCLGDYSLDFWKWNEGGSYLQPNPVSNTDHFVKEVCYKFPLKPYMIAGNHEQYGNEKFKQITGWERQFIIEYGDIVFVMCDTFGDDLDPSEHSDGTYSGVDPEFLKKVVVEHRNKKIILCMHDFQLENESEELKQLLEDHSNILCAFAGHTHRKNGKIVKVFDRYFPIFYCGNFSYGKVPDVCDWGYMVVDFNNGVSCDYKLAQS